MVIVASLTLGAIGAIGAIGTPATAVVVAGMPNQKLTPGAINPDVTQANLGQTICVAGFTKTIRPSTSYTNALKRSQLNSGYNVGGDTLLSHYEEDHLLPLEIGGAPKDKRNLWPEPRFGANSAAMKDKLENKIHLLICSGAITLKEGQAIFMIDWVAGYRKYYG